MNIRDTRRGRDSPSKKSWRGPTPAERRRAADTSLLNSAAIRGDHAVVASERARLAGRYPDLAIDPPPPARERIVTDYWRKPGPEAQAKPFDWSATLDGYEPGDPIGYGETEEAAIIDLRIEIEARS